MSHRPWEESADFSIGLSPIDEARWLEGGEADPAARKDPLYAAHRELVWGETPASRPGQAEAAALLGITDPGGLPPLYAAARTVADDLVLMEKTDGAWRVAAISLSAPTFFTAREVLGRSLAEIHGPVNGFSDRFLARLVRIFDGLRPGLILQRRNWSVVNSGETFTPFSGPIRARIGEISPSEVGQALFTRVERQTVRRLPATGGVLFSIRVWLTPFAELAQTPERLAAFAEAWRAAAPDFAAYKGFHLYADLVEAFLRAEGESHSVNGA
ncbi:heme-dependent oxidative N-demethylase subunit alpha family protein [Phenylobacterium sp.]|uniref:heme-dependent oxidative N-demethylase subunit alpha family protein n=1 Tax=Phenylobacterium sp. TaxID=1871053 RepID=UPI003BAA994E